MRPIHKARSPARTQSDAAITTQSNRLPILQDNARAAHADALRLASAAAERALTAGAALAEAKALCPHGTWAEWLAQTGIQERMAQRYMRLHRLALNPDMVTDLGGIDAALAWAAPLRLPMPGQMLAGFRGDPDMNAPLVGVWADRPGFHIGLLDLSKDHPCIAITRRPVLDDRAAWTTLWQALGQQQTFVRFVLLGTDQRHRFAGFLHVMAEERAALHRAEALLAGGAA